MTEGRADGTAMSMVHRALHAVIFVVVAVVWQIVTCHQHGYGDGVGDGNGDGYGNAERRQRQRYNNQPQGRGGGTEQQQRRLAWRRRQRWIVARRRQMTGLIEGDLGITARRGQRTSTTIPGGAVDSLDCGEGRVFSGAMAIVCHPSPNRQRMRGRATSCAARVWTTPQRERTAGGIATTTGGPDNGDINVKALAVRATHCQ
jgi:hypothetical protein